MTSSHPGTLLQLNPGCNDTFCSATTIGTPGFAVRSLPVGTHDVHQLRCVNTGELLGEWTEADKTFSHVA